jgi:beta-glucanase (GH16 family)
MASALAGRWTRLLAVLGVVALAAVLLRWLDVYGAHAVQASGISAPLRLAWSENFNGARGSSPDPARWNFDIGGTGWGDAELESHTSRPRNAQLDGHGHLVITARAETRTGPEGITRRYTSARLETLRKFHFEYGLVQARVKVPAGQGLLPQFWMLGENAYHAGGWPASGEIDTMEILGSEPHVVKGTIHGPWSWAPPGVSGGARSATSLASGFHVYGVKWEPETIEFLLDSVVYETIRRDQLPAGAAWPFQHRFFLLLDIAVGGTGAGAPSAKTRFPAKMIVDWVRVWQWQSTTSGG